MYKYIYIYMYVHIYIYVYVSLYITQRYTVYASPASATSPTSPPATSARWAFWGLAPRSPGPVARSVALPVALLVAPAPTLGCGLAQQKRGFTTI